MKYGCIYGENLSLSTVFLIFHGCSGTQRFKYSSAHAGARDKFKDPEVKKTNV
jgi:hypothetical protein